MYNVRWFPLAVLACLAALPSVAQTLSGSLSGSVVDPSGLPLSAATVTLTNDATSERRQQETGASGTFIFSAVLPGRYALTTDATGFKRLQKTNLNVTAGERLVAGTMHMELGAVTESVTVVARGSAVEVESNDRSALLTGDQMQQLLTRGRSYMSLLQTIPGTVADDRTFEPDGVGGLTPSFGGADPILNSVFSDGAVNSDPVNPNYHAAASSMDSIAEVKVSLNNYRAEDGRNGGAIIKTVSKSGTREFHGSAYHFHRNEALNANYFFNNANSVPRPRYRFQTSGYTIGGPIYWPGKFNSGKNKLFFFFSQEFNPVNQPQPLVQVTVPTAAEKRGDFSQTVDLNNKLVPIKDPLNGAAPFPGNVLPANRLDARGQALLNLFPDANFFDRAVSRGNYNYNFQEVTTDKSHMETIKIDWNASEQLRAFFRLNLNSGVNESYGGSGQKWPMMLFTRESDRIFPVLNVSYTISPSAINELNVAFNNYDERGSVPEAELNRYNRDKLNLGIAQFFPANNPLRMAPSAAFGGITGAAKLGTGTNFIQRQGAPIFSVNDSFTKIQGVHTLKFGLSFERARTTGTGTGTYAGNFAFKRDSNNPYDTNWAYSNALVGAFQAYSETDIRPAPDVRGVTLEWYAQDTWKATRRLTLDLGLRFTYSSPWTQANGLGMGFLPSLYDPAEAVVLYEPFIDAKKKRVARNPLTGELGAPALIGAIVPGHGNPYNGMAAPDGTRFPRGFRHSSLHAGPRAGFAWDVFGDGRTALRGGIGVSYQTRPRQTFTRNLLSNMQMSLTTYNGHFDILTPDLGIAAPRSLSSFDPHQKDTAIYSYSFGVQRDIGFGTVADVAYVASLGRHVLQRQTQLNEIPLGARFLPENQDPTNNKPKAANFIRPYIGYTNIAMARTSSTNYHSLQTQVNRRFAHGLQFTASWTWSKGMGYGEPFPTYYSNELNYSKTSLDRTHIFVLSYLYDIPELGRRLGIAPARWILDGWQVSGITRFISGKPFGVGYSLTGGEDLLGGGDFDRVVVLRNPQLSRSERTRDRHIDRDAFIPPSRELLGNAPLDVFRGPGRNNWDVSIFKNFNAGERAKVQFRWELYNIFNHPSFNNVDTTARFDAQRKQVNEAFGRLTGTLTPRVMQLALRLSF